MIQWNPEQFEDATRTGRVDFRTNSSSGIIEFVNGEMHIVEPKYDATPTWHSDLHFGGWHDLLQTQGDIILRLLCVRCISNMPSSALPETLESLREIYTYWSENECVAPEQKALPEKIQLTNLNHATRREVIIPEEDE